MTRRPGADRQLVLQFPRLDPGERPLIEAGVYTAPVSALRRWRGWPDGRLALTGEAGSGRTRLLLHWAAETGAAYASGADLANADIDAIAALTISALAVDDADQECQGAGLLAAINLCGRRGAPILLSGKGDPAQWHLSPPDLRSRLQAMSSIGIAMPDAFSLSLRLREECARRHLNVPEEVLAFLCERLPLSWAAPARLADQLEDLPARAFTLRSARTALSRMGVQTG